MTSMRPWKTLALALLAVSSAASLTVAQGPVDEPSPSPFDHLEWRNIGPVNMSGRVTDVEGVAGDPRTVYVGAAAGGVWKTTNGGLTFEPIFDEMPIASIGDLALAPSNPDVIYVGTGESNSRNSVSFGNGVYKSTDGGGTWRHLGLDDTRHISRVLVHPRDPDTVFVGALGHLFGPNEERGVFRTTDGGATWEKVLHLDDRHGVADLDMDPRNPNVLFAALWHFERKPWSFTSGSEEGGVFRSVDGGDTWTKLTDGLPSLLGRIGVKVAPSNPQVVYVIAESNEGTLFRSDDRGDSFTKTTDDVDIVSRGFYYTDLRVDPSDENRVYAVSSRLFRSLDGGKSFERISRSTHVDFHSLWIDPADPDRLWQGQDGGVAVSYDRGETWEPIRNLPLGQFYQVFHDLSEPFYVVGGGLQDNGTWYGPSRTREPAGILPDDWRMMSFGDAYFVVPHPEIPELFISESQAGGILRTDMKTRQQIDISPQPRRNDGGPVGELEFRFNWNSPIVSSPHDPEKVYFAGNVVFESHDFGTTWKVISPDLTTDDPEKQGEAGGPVWFENTTAEYHTTIISFAESPVAAGTLWAGTDDGRVQVTRNGGETWTDVTANLPGLPPFSPVSHLEPSRTGAEVAYAAFDRHMWDDPAPHLFKTNDAGATWTRLEVAIEPASWIWVVREDPRYPELLWIGTELGLFISRDAGESWQRFHLGNLPTVPVHDILIHPRDNDVILGTHGRAIWIFDDATPLQDWNVALAAETAHLFPVRPALHIVRRRTGYGLGDKQLLAPNPPAGALLTYSLKEERKDGEGPVDDGADAAAGAGGVQLEILDGSGTVIRTLEDFPLEAGLNRTAWDLYQDPPRPRRQGEGEAGDFRTPARGPAVLPGTYTARLTVDGVRSEQPVEVRVDPTLEVSADALAAQYEAASKLTAMRTRANALLRGLDLLEAQLDERRQLAEGLELQLTTELEDLWTEAEEQLEALKHRLARPEGKPFWSQGPRLVDRLGDLKNSIDEAFAAPTAAQGELLLELEAELEKAVSDWRQWRSGEGAALSDALEDAGLPAILIPE